MKIQISRHIKNIRNKSLIVFIGVVAVAGVGAIFANKSVSKIDTTGRVEKSGDDQGGIAIRLSNGTILNTASLYFSGARDLLGKKTDIDSLREDDVVSVSGFMTKNQGLLVFGGVDVLNTPNKYEITEYDRGETFDFAQGEVFGVILDGKSFAADSLTCAPEEVLKPLSVATSSKSDFFEKKFEAAEPGLCRISQNGFVVYIQVLKK